MCVCVAVCACVCMNANAREEQPNLALTFIQSSFVCVCVRGCITDALWYRLLKWRAKGYPSVTSNFVSVNCKCGSVRWDVIRAAVTWAWRCVCARVCLWVFVFVMRMYHGCFSTCIFEMESKERSNCHVELCQCELQMQVRQL